MAIGDEATLVAMTALRHDDTRRGKWLRGLLARAHADTAVVDLAAEMACIVWALLRYGRVYEPMALTALSAFGPRGA